MLCPNCGTTNDAGARFCARCGAALPMADARPALHPGQTMNGGQFRITRQLGHGGMGAIYLAANTHAFDRLCVIKEMIAYYEPGDEAKARERFEREARTLASLKHPGIPDMYGYFSEGGHNYIVMEYIEGEDLENALERSPEGLDVDEVVRYGVEVCRVLEYLAAISPEPVVHCDVKPANIIIDRNSRQAVLVDFGTAKTRYLRSAAAPDPRRASVYGTVGYAPPELYRGEATPKADVFSLAATMYHLLTGDDPREHPFQWPGLESIPPQLRLTLEQALANEEEARLDAEAFRRQLEAFRAARASTIQPLVFPEGNAATTLTGVLDLALRYWGYAREILYDGSLDAWLRHTLHDPVAANVAAEAVREHAGTPDAGLVAFLRTLNPRLPEPAVTLTPAEVTLERSPSASASLEASNAGPGGWYGAVTTSAPWLRVTPHELSIAPGERVALQLGVDARALPQGAGRETARVMLGASQPVAEARVRLRGATASAAAPPAARPARPAPARPAATPRRRTVGRVLMALALLTALAILALEVLPLPIGGADVERGVEALQAGDWARARRLLANLDGTDGEQVRAVASVLNDEMVTIPAGTLRMGRDDGAIDERPVRDVPVAALDADRLEVTNVQYRWFVIDQGLSAPAGWSGSTAYPRGEALHPVTGVTWADAEAYCAWAGKRLPTEAEWEWIARGPEGRLFPWGAVELSPPPANSGNPEDGSIIAVGGHPDGATPLGVLDMAGNVREWTADRYGPYRDPHAPPEQGTRMAVRGSSWRTYNDVASARESADADTAADDLGFRCVR